MVWTNRSRDIKKRWQEYTELYKKDLHDPDSHDGVITHIQSDTAERLTCLFQLSSPKFHLFSGMMTITMYITSQ